MTVRSDAWRLYVSRSARGLVDGAVSVLLASYCTHLGFSALQTGAIVTGTLLGSAALTLAVGLFGYSLSRRTVLVAMSVLMATTGLAFAAFDAFWALLVVAVVGTVNPSSGDVTPFLPTEQAVLAEVVPSAGLTGAYAWYSLAGNLSGALGALAAGVPAFVSKHASVEVIQTERAAFLVYAAVGAAIALVYARLSEDVESSAPVEGGAVPAKRGALSAESRKVVLKLSALFSLDAFGGGFAVQSLLALWLFRRFGFSTETAGSVFFGMGLLAGFSQLLAPKLAARIGKIRTMVFTHLPAQIFLMIAGVMPTAPLAVTFLMLRMSLSSMDVPARQAFVMSVVPPHERSAASSVTNVPRSLASALSPLIAGALLQHSNFGWPLLIAGALKGTYDLLMFQQFRQHAADRV